MRQPWSGRIPWHDPHRLPFNRSLPAVYRLSAPAPSSAEEDALARDPALARLEAALFAADEPLAVRRLAAVAGLADAAQARQLVARLQALYDADGSAFQVEELAGGYQLLTRPAYQQWLARMNRRGNDLRLSAAARETLAVIAYRQPVGRADVEAIRGVQCAEVLRQLMEKGLVRISGRDTTLGRPVLYGTTRKFLQAFGLKSLRDLPVTGQMPAPRKTADGGEEADG